MVMTEPLPPACLIEPHDGCHKMLRLWFLTIDLLVECLLFEELEYAFVRRIATILCLAVENHYYSFGMGVVANFLEPASVASSAPKEEKTMFNLKLESFDVAAKIKIISDEDLRELRMKRPRSFNTMKNWRICYSIHWGDMYLYKFQGEIFLTQSLIDP